MIERARLFGEGPEPPVEDLRLGWGHNPKRAVGATHAEFEASPAPPIRPYFDRMPTHHQRAFAV